MAGVDTLKTLFDEKKINILQVFIQKPGEEFTLKEIVKQSKVPLATTFRVLKDLAKKDLVEKTKHKHLTTYQLASGPDAQYLGKLLYERPQPIEAFVERAKHIENIDRIIMHGKATESKANVVLIGSDISKEAVHQAIISIREDFNFTITHLILEEEQFAMLESMGQFSGNRTILYTT